MIPTVTGNAGAGIPNPALMRGRIRRWFHVGSKFAGLEILTQVIGLAAALVIVRNLSKTQFAWYTLANNLQGTLAMFSLMGVGSGLLAMGGACLGDKVRMGQVVAAASSQRLLLFGIAAPVAVPVFGYLLWKNDCPLWTIAGLVIAAILLFFLAVADQVISSPLGLAGRYNIGQTTGAVAALLRLLAVTLLLISGRLFSVPLMLASLVTGAVGVWLRVPYSRRYVQFGFTAPREVKERFRRLMVVQMPSILTYMFEGQVAGLLVARLGHTGDVADLGALSRLGLLLAVPSAFVTKILTPRLAAEKNPHRLKMIWLISVCLSLAVSLALFGVTAMLRKPALWVLGPQYAGLETELVLYAGFVGFSFLVAASCAIVQARAWMRHSWWRPIAVFGCQALAIGFVSPGTVRGAIMVMFAGSVGHFLVEAFLIVNGFRGRGDV